MSAHAATKFCITFPLQTAHWMRYWQNIVCLSCADEAALEHLRSTLSGQHIVTWNEPDLDGELTAIAVMGNDRRIRSVLNKLPLALKAAA